MQAQEVSGEWYGIGTVSRDGDHNNYLAEMVLTQKGNKVTGHLHYYFRNLSLDVPLKGTYDGKTRTLILEPREIINFKAVDQNGADCPMEGSFTLLVSRAESSLYGQFNPSEKYKYTCPAITIKFVKYNPEDHITISEKIPITNLDEELIPKPEIINPYKEQEEKLAERTFEDNPVIEVDSDSLKIILYDNGEVDNDTISLYYDRKLLAYKKMLSHKPQVFMVPIDTSIHEISMYAENLGTIPPNTALCIVYDGEKRHELIMISTYIKNGAYRFRRKVKPKTE